MRIVNGLTDETNLPGLALLLIVPVFSADNFPLTWPIDHNSMDVSLINLSHPDYLKWIPIYHTIDTGILNEEADMDDQGPNFKYSIDCIIPKDYNYRQKQFDELIQMEHLVITRDQNNLARIIGHMENEFSRGAKMKWKFNTGKTSKERNGYALNFTFEGHKKAVPATNLNLLSIETGSYV